MNTFETDLKRAIISFKFLAGIIIEYIILKSEGFNSELFLVAVPVLATLPYSTAWLSDYQHGYIKEYIPRCGSLAYITGKFFACGISGGILEAAGCFLYSLTAKKVPSIDYLLVFMSGMLWAVIAATLAAMSNSRYIAYGGSFVIYYVMVIVHDRYLENIYCLYPYEWISPKHEWVFGNEGIVILLSSLIVILYFVYSDILRRCISRV